MITMTIQQRATTKLALMAHLKLIKTAQKAVNRALVSSMEIPIAEARVDEALRLVPSSSSTRERWEAQSPIIQEYKDALYLLGQAVLKVREKEVEQGIDTASSDERLAEIKALLRELGDQRELFVEETEEGDKSQIDFTKGKAE